jgi:hypothetical protein
MRTKSSTVPDFSILRFTVEIPSKTIHLTKDFFTALCLVLASEALLYWGVASGSRPLVLFGLNIDPSQPVPCFFIALIVSGGPTVVAWFQVQAVILKETYKHIVGGNQ